MSQPSFAFCGMLPVESGQIMFFIFFLVASISGHCSRPDPKHGQGEGGGKANPMWTQWTHVDPDGKYDEWGYDERRGVMYMVSGSETMQPKLGFLM